MNGSGDQKIVYEREAGSVTLSSDPDASKLTCSGVMEAADLHVTGLNMTVADMAAKIATLEAAITQLTANDAAKDAEITQLKAQMQHVLKTIAPITSPPSSPPPPPISPPNLPPRPPVSPPSYPPIMPPLPAVIALWSPTHQRFMRMSSETTWIDRSDVSTDATLPHDWVWERFRVINAGQEIALWNPTHQRFVRMGNGQVEGSSLTWLDRSDVSTDASLPSHWAWEKFRVIDVGEGNVALWNPTHQRFVRMGNGTLGSSWTWLDMSTVRTDASLPSHWAWEKFRVVDAES